jgi:hypothetical protein
MIAIELLCRACDYIFKMYAFSDVKSGRFIESSLHQLCDNVESLWVNGYHSSEGYNDRLPLEVANEKLTSSLLFIRPTVFEIEKKESSFIKKKLRGEFIYKGERYNLAVTDPRFEENYSDKSVGLCKIINDQIYLCISLGEPFGEYCYKLIVGIILIR